MARDEAMVTCDERRRVAERLRGLDYSDLQESLICAYLDALGIKGYEDWIGIAHRLADLIEPPSKLYDSPDSSNSEADEGHEVAIDRDALLALADELEGEGLEGWASGPINVGEYARRIREACGEVVA